MARKLRSLGLNEKVIFNNGKWIIQMKKMDFSSATPSLIFDLANSDKSINFEKYSFNKNFGLINQVFDSLDMLKDIPQEMRTYSANYPNTTIFNDEKEIVDNNG